MKLPILRRQATRQRRHAFEPLSDRMAHRATMDMVG